MGNRLTMPSSLILTTPEATVALGGQVAARLAPGEAVCLFGPLGAGKSTLARGLIRALTTPDEDVPSPTFTLVQAYEAGAFDLHHFDLYRLKAAGEVEELGLWEALVAGVAVIEWPERMEGRLPPHRLDIEIIVPLDGDTGRAVTLTGVGRWVMKDQF